VSSSKESQALNFSVRKISLESETDGLKALSSKPDKRVRTGKVARALNDYTIEPESARLILIFVDDLSGDEWIVEGIVLQDEDGSILAAPTTLIYRDRAAIPLANPSLIPKIIRRGEIVGLIHDSDKWAQKPRTQNEHTSMETSATKIAQLIQSLAKIEEDRTSGLVPIGQDLTEVIADDFTPSGPKTAEIASNESFSSEDLHKLVNMGPDIPPEILPRLSSVLTKNVQAFGVDG
jgi:hypothetical protein